VTSRSRLIRARTIISIAALLAALFAGCKKSQKPSAAEIHAITREFAAALRGAAPVEVRTELRATDQNPESVDLINITVRADSNDAAQAIVVRLLRALGGVATHYRLSQDGPLESREGQLYRYLRAGNVTHQLHIHEQITSASRELPPSQEGAGPRLAIILDDLGNDRATADAIFALQCPITISLLPNHPHSADIAEEAHRRGYQVMLHLPMKSVGNERPEAQELQPGMSADEVSAMVGNLLQAVPEVAGVNNHQGSQSTADAALMGELMPVLRSHNLFYIDSRTTAATVAYDTAQRFGVRSAFRNVPFLDDVAEVGAVRKQLNLALRDAHKKGDAIAIGHPHPATLQALREILPQAKSQGVHLVFVSELVH
jgi:hypothetical protein